MTTGIVVSGYGCAAILAAPLTGLGVDLTGGYVPGRGIALAMALAGLVLHIALRSRDSDPVASVFP